MKRKPKLHSLPINQQLEIIGQRANTRQINANDRYLEVYPELLAGMQALLPLTRQNLVLAAHAVFGWMPTQLRVDVGQLENALKILQRVLQFGEEPHTQDLAFLASTFQTARGNSIVAASKILHFLAPDCFPMWDRLVAKAWGVQANGGKAAENYYKFATRCREFSTSPIGKQACATLRKKLKHAGYDYQITDMRAIELIFYLPP